MAWLIKRKSLRSYRKNLWNLEAFKTMVTNKDQFKSKYLSDTMEAQCHVDTSAQTTFYHTPS